METTNDSNDNVCLEKKDNRPNTEDNIEGAKNGNLGH